MKRKITPKQIAKYKETIRSAYEKNEQKIKAAFPIAPNPLKEFEAEILGNMEVTGKNVKQAIKSTFRSELFQAPEERMAHNLITGLRNHSREIYEKWRKFTRHQKIEYENFSYKGWNEDGTAQIYQYAIPNNPQRIITIYVLQSPKGFQIERNW